VQFNSASQDFVAITLLESSVAGCYPVYPYFRSFPETFLYEPEFMYQHLDLNSAAAKLNQVLTRDDLWTPEAIKSRSWIHSRFDSSWLRMLMQMGISIRSSAPGRQNIECFTDPFIRGNWLN
jgi:hypothetical protein